VQLIRLRKPASNRLLLSRVNFELRTLIEYRWYLRSCLPAINLVAITRISGGARVPDDLLYGSLSAARYP
jgi:hypothetical protein